MNEFEVYKMYLALKLHFTTDFDIQKYSGKSKAKVSSYEKRKDKVFFQKLAKHNDPYGVILSNFLKDKNAWAGSIAYNEDSEKIYRQWIKTQSSLSYIFKNDLERLDPELKNNFIIPANEHPLILRLVASGSISIESFIIIISITGTFIGLTRKLNDDIVWNKYAEIYKKYLPFLTFDKEKFKKLLKSHFNLNN